jgi:hypothetical protein
MVLGLGSCLLLDFVFLEVGYGVLLITAFGMRFWDKFLLDLLILF